MNGLRNSLHRGAKGLMDTGEANSPEEAMEILGRFGLTVYAGPEIAESATLQAALLTIVNTGSRCLLRGVTVVGCPDVLTQIPVSGASSLAAAVEQWGGRLGPEVDADVPGVVLGSPREVSRSEAPCIRATFDGWIAGVAPADEEFRLPETREFPPSGVLAGALAVSEAFQHLRGRNAQAMRREVGLSLWRPEARGSWAEPALRGPAEYLLPERLWVIGLGHLGQAFLWTLTMLPYAEPGAMTLVLQDFDRITESNYSTSLLTSPMDVGRMKTRLAAEYCEQLGFRTVLVERPFDERLLIGPKDPLLAFCGVDNPEARRCLEGPGFTEVIEAGLGHQGEEYLAFALHSFPASRRAKDVWSGTSGSEVAQLLAQPAYQGMLSRGEDECGLIEVAGATVAVPFVGAVTSALAVTEAIRATMGVHRYELIDGSLRDPKRARGMLRAPDPEPGNLGYLRCQE